MTLIHFLEIKEIIEAHYGKHIETYRYSNPLLARDAEKELEEWKVKVREILKV